MKMIGYTILLLLLQGLDATILSLNETEYARMPPVIKMDPYELCIDQHGGLYCDVELTLVSDTPSELLTMMREYSALTATHYNHTRLHYSVCVTKTCSDFYNRSGDLKSTLEACFNHSLWQTYQLKARVSDGFSCNVHEKHLDIGAGDIIVAGICLTILVANLIGSLWDLFCATVAESKGVQLLQCFSIARNWRKLVAPTGAMPHLKQFQSVHGIRVLTMFGVISFHAVLPFILFSENTRLIEEMYNYPLNKILANATLVMQTFLMISGMLLIYNAQMYAETRSVSWATVPKLILMRWWRLTPPHAIVLGLTATWFRYVSTGPRWQVMAGDEAQSCRQYWWLHLLYINNYFDNSQCMGHTWYLAADTQLYYLGVLVYVMCRSTTTKKVVLSLLLIAGIIAPALHTYFQDLDALVITSPEIALKLFMDNPTFDNVYKRGHTNLAGYVIGLCIGYLIYDWQKSGFDEKKHKSYRFLCWGAFPLMLCVLYSGSVFYSARPRDHAVLRAVYAGLSRPVFSVLVATILVATIMRVEGAFRGVLAWRGWAAPSRLCYCAYLCHIACIRYAASALTTTVHGSTARFTENTLMTVVASFAAGLVLWLLVEAPMANSMKLVTGGMPQPTKTASELEKGTVDVPKL